MASEACLAGLSFLSTKVSAPAQASVGVTVHLMAQICNVTSKWQCFIRICMEHDTPQSPRIRCCAMISTIPGWGTADGCCDLWYQNHPEKLTIDQSGTRIGGLVVLLLVDSRSAVGSSSARCAQARLAGVASALGAPSGRLRCGPGAAWNLYTPLLCQCSCMH